MPLPRIRGSSDSYSSSTLSDLRRAGCIENRQPNVVVRYIFYIGCDLLNNLSSASRTGPNRPRIVPICFCASGIGSGGPRRIPGGIAEAEIRGLHALNRRISPTYNAIFVEPEAIAGAAETLRGLKIERICYGIVQTSPN